MFARIQSLALVSVFALCVSAGVVSRTGGGDGSPATCNANTGAQQCCNSLASSTSPAAVTLIGLLGIVSGITAQVGLTCSPITVVGLGTSQCNSQAVCCSGNSFSGLIVLGCSPINL